jgi:hypothetical protein
MRISFDLDDTLICYREGVPREPRLSWLRRLFVGDEPLRLGARVLMQNLADRGCELWIYTTSNRDPKSLRRWFRYHGVSVAGVINQDMHDRHFRRTRQARPPSKNPRAFGIDLHVDDSDGVKIEGERHGFSVVVVSPDDKDWVAQVLQAVAEQQERRSTN